MVPDVAFDISLDHGRCVGVHLPQAPGAIDALAETSLVFEERAFAGGLAPARRRTWVGGRVAMRQALARLGLDAPPLLPDARGAPMLPDAIAGSISHKDHLAVALVAGTAGPGDPARSGGRVGVDLEIDDPRPRDIAARVLTSEEAASMARLGASAYAREVLLRFSAKEAIYKALDPFVRRYVAFQEVAVQPLPDGSAEVEQRLRAGEGPFSIEVRWLRRQGFVLTTARVARAR